MSEPRIHLYHCADARSFRALWALEELGLPYELTLMPFPPRHFVEGYRDLNPLGTVPACFIDGALMTESAAILIDLADRHPDVLELDAASNNSVDDVRMALTRSAPLSKIRRIFGIFSAG